MESNDNYFYGKFCVWKKCFIVWICEYLLVSLPSSGSRGRLWEGVCRRGTSQPDSTPALTTPPHFYRERTAKRWIRTQSSDWALGGLTASFQNGLLSWQFKGKRAGQLGYGKVGEGFDTTLNNYKNLWSVELKTTGTVHRNVSEEVKASVSKKHTEDKVFKRVKVVTCLNCQLLKQKYKIVVVCIYLFWSICLIYCYFFHQIDSYFKVFRICSNYVFLV